jgi:hypothetical protein
VFKFLLKLVVFVAIVVGVGAFIANKNGLLPGLLKGYVDPSALNKITQTGISQLGPQLSGALDSLVTHPNRNSPVVLGLKVSNDSLNAVVDLIQRLPPDQIAQIKNTICSPASPSSSQ